MDIFNSGVFDFSNDLDFYMCNILYWKQKLISFGLNISLPIDKTILLKEQCIDNAGRVFNSGPVFPIILMIMILLGNSNYLLIFFLFLLLSYLFLARKVTFLKDKSSKNILIVLLILCPSILWLTYLLQLIY